MPDQWERVLTSGLPDGTPATVALGTLGEDLYMFGSAAESAGALAGVWRLKADGWVLLDGLGAGRRFGGIADFNRLLGWGAVEYQGHLYAGDRRGGRLRRLDLHHDGSFAALPDVGQVGGEDVFPGPVFDGKLWLGTYGNKYNTGLPLMAPGVYTYDGTAVIQVLSLEAAGIGGQVTSLTVHNGLVWVTALNEAGTRNELWTLTPPSAGPVTATLIGLFGAIKTRLCEWRGELYAIRTPVATNTAAISRWTGSGFTDLATFTDTVPNSWNGIYAAGDRVLAVNHYSGVRTWDGATLATEAGGAWAPDYFGERFGGLVSLKYHAGYLYAATSQPVKLWRRGMPAGPVPGPRYDLSLGRIGLVTADGEPSESLGDAIEAAGSAVVAGERGPKAVKLKLPVYGSHREPDPKAAGDRLRRQVAGLLDNAVARLQGLYLACAFDERLKGWLVAGGGDLAYTQAGVTFGDYTLELGDAFLYPPRSHRPGRRLEGSDRRLATTPRDHLRRVYSTDFAGQAALALHSLPVLALLPPGAADARGTTGPVTLATRRSEHGHIPVVANGVEGDVVAFDELEADGGKGDVVVYDRRAPAPNPPTGLGLTGAWRTETALPAARYYHGSVVVGGRIYVTGGIGGNAAVASTAVAADGTLGVWRTELAMPAVRYQHGTVVVGGRIYVVGGWDSAAAAATVWSAAVAADGTLSAWRTETALPTTRYAHTTTVVGGRIYVFGGYPDVAAGTPPLATVLSAAIAADGTLSAWRTETALPVARVSHASIAAGGRVYVIGGSSLTTVWSAAVAADGTLGVWRTETALPAVRNQHAAVAVGGRIYVTGGATLAAVLSAAVAADGTLSAWRTETEMPTTRYTHAAVVVGGRIYNSGGYTGITGTAAVVSAAALAPGAYSPPVDRGWEEVYGPDQPTTESDVPVLDNGLCRVRWNGTYTEFLDFALDVYQPGVGWAERGRIGFRRWVVEPHDKLVSARLVEWTPERAVVHAVTRHNPSGERYDVYLTLQRGWTGPRVEVYGSGQVGVVFEAADAPIGLYGPGKPFWADGDNWLNGDDRLGYFTDPGSEPWAALLAPAGRPTVVLSPVQAGVGLFAMRGYSSGEPRPIVGIENEATTGPGSGYVSATFAVAPSALRIEAEGPEAGEYNAATVVADAAASGGQAVDSTAVTEGELTTFSIHQDTLPALPSIAAGRYGFLARVRVTTAGATGSIRAGFVLNDNTASPDIPATFTSVTYVWVWVGEGTLTKVEAGWGQLWVRAWRSAGTGTVRVDRVVAVPVERRQPTDLVYDGARDAGQANLYDARPVPALLAR